MSAVFRPIAPSDLDRILTINTANVPEVGPLDAERLRYLVDESTIGMAVDIDDLLVGFCLVLAPGSDYDSVNYRWFMEHHPASLYLDRVAIDESMRGRGIGARLYVEFGDRAAGRGCTRVRALAPLWNAQSIAFHERLGFVGSPQRDFVGPGQDRVVFERALPIPGSTG